MKAISYSELRSNLKEVLDRVSDDRQPVIVTRRGGKQAVLISYEEYSSMEETAYLLASPKNAERLRVAVKRLEQGQGEGHELVE